MPLPVLATTHNYTVQVNDKDGKPLAGMVVYLTPAKGIEGLPVNSKPLMIDQIGKKFAPYVTVMQKGQAINFNNHDDITHHIYSVSGGNRFEFKLKAGMNKTTDAMQVTDEIAMGCNIHDWMSGYALVVDTPYFGRSNEHGQVVFQLHELGDYQLTVWHPQLNEPHNRISEQVIIDKNILSATYQIKLTSELGVIPAQESEDEFDFLEEY